MAYSDFTLAKVRAAFGLTFEENKSLFRDILEIPPSEFLREALEYYVPLASAINTEKARSELIIAPVLFELRRRSQDRVSVFSGSDFNVDPSQGLSGYCDFILSSSGEIYDIVAPVFAIVEAKNENIKAGLGQCIAEMVAAQIFNERQENRIDIIYGAVTTGTLWKFLALEERKVCIDRDEYYIQPVGKILGILNKPLEY